MTLAFRRSRVGRAGKRTFDVVVAATALLAVSPLLLIALIGIKLTSPGPVFYKAKRVGMGGANFSMLKFRTMHVGSDRQSAITAPDDRRVFRFGRILRQLKIDELPQFWNILSGDMSLVGPRPEDPKIVEHHYTAWMRETLEVPPGVTSPGAVYGYVFGDDLLDAEDPEGSYVSKLMPPKLALERAYLDRAGFLSDLHYIVMTASAILLSIFRRKVRLPDIDIRAASRWAPQGPYPSKRT